MLIRTKPDFDQIVLLIGIDEGFKRFFMQNFLNKEPAYTSTYHSIQSDLMVYGKRILFRCVNTDSFHPSGLWARTMRNNADTVWLCPGSQDDFNQMLELTPYWVNTQGQPLPQQLLTPPDFYLHDVPDALTRVGMPHINRSKPLTTDEKQAYLGPLLAVSLQGQVVNRPTAEVCKR